MSFHEYPYTNFHEMNLDWVVKKVKELAAAWAQVQQDWTNEQAAFANLQSWIENYFNNLDVQTEINVKLDAMVAAGTMSELIAPYVASGLPAEVAEQIGDVVAVQIGPVVAAQIGAVVADQLPAVAAAAAAQEVSAWLALHVNPETGYVIDDTFTVQGAAADAKAVGDEFTAIKSALSNFESDIEVNETMTGWEDGTFGTADGNPTPNDSRIRTNAFRSASDGTYGVKSSNSFTFSCYAYNISNGAYVGNVKTDGSVATGSSDIAYVDSFILARYPSYKFKFVLKNSTGSSAIVPSDGANVTEIHLTDRTLSKANKIADAKETGDAIAYEDSYIKSLATKYATIGLSDLVWNDGYYMAINGTPVENSSYRYSEPIEVKEGDTITYTIMSVNNIAIALGAYDKNMALKLANSVYYDANYASGELVTFSGSYVVPQGIKFIVICQNSLGANQSLSMPCYIALPKSNESRIDTIEHDLEVLDLANQWYNKKWVAFGTSITDNWSEYSYITYGDHAGEHTGKYVPYLLDMSELSSGSFKNRGIAGGSINGHILYYLRYYTSDMANADLITIEGAVNDFASNIPLGEVGDTVPYTNALLPDGTADGTFAGACYQAFTTAITNAPNAVVVLLTETTGKATSVDSYVQTRTNSLGLYQKDYIDMTIAVAKFVGIPVIECGSESMINAQNPQYIADHIHHTYLGGYQYARTIWAKLRNIPLKALVVPN